MNFGGNYIIEIRLRIRCCYLTCVLLIALPLVPAIADGPLGSVQVENALLKTIESTRLAAEVAGRIDALNVVEGDSVAVDQQLGKIRDTAVKLQVARAKIAVNIAVKKQKNDIDLRLAKKRSEVANSELERAQAANARIPNTYQPKEVDRMQLLAASAMIEIERAVHEQEVSALDALVAQNELLQAENLLARHQIRSPVVGVVIAINKRVGEWVEPGTELLEIVRIDRLRIEGFIKTSAISKQLVGRQASVTVLKGDEERKLEGKVVFVSPDANPVNGQVRVYLEIDNGKGEFRPGMRVNATIAPDTPGATTANVTERGSTQP